MNDSDIKKIQNNLTKQMRKGGGLQNSEMFKPNTLNNDKDKEKIEKTKQVLKIREKLQNNFKNANQREINNEIRKEKAFEPVVKVLRDIKNAVNKTDVDSHTELVPVKTSTLIEQPIHTENKPKMISSFQTPTRDEENQTIKTPETTHLGNIAAQKLIDLRDKAFGIWIYDNKTTNKKGHAIGKYAISFNDNDIILNKNRYTGTEGLWNLLTQSNLWDETNNIILPYTDEDLKTYKKILLETDSIYQKNDKKTGKPKSSSSNKYNLIIKNIWNEMKKPSEHVGEGLKYYTENPVEYMYINNLNQIINRLCRIAEEERAGNNNFHNEKLGMVTFFKNEMEKLIDSPKSTEYLIEIIKCLPKKLIKGEGLVNHILNSKFIPEMHWPTYNYLGPGTKLNKNKKPVNKLDEAAKEHDIYYEKNKDTKSRHKADLILEHKAWERFSDPNVSLGEKSAAWVTTNIMKTKRKLGMGLI